MRDKLRGVWLYVREVWTAGELLVGSLVMTLLLAGLDWALEGRVPAWCYVVLMVTILIVAQYRAWRHAWSERGTPDAPCVSSGLRLRYQGVSRDRQGLHHLEAQIDLGRSPEECFLLIVCSDVLYPLESNFDVSSPGGGYWLCNAEEAMLPYQANAIALDLRAGRWQKQGADLVQPETILEVDLAAPSPIKIIRLQLLSPAEAGRIARPLPAGPA